MRFNVALIVDVCDINLCTCEAPLSISAGSNAIFTCSTFYLPGGAWSGGAMVLLNFQCRASFWFVVLGLAAL